MKNLLPTLLIFISTLCFAQQRNLQGVYLAKDGNTNMLALIVDGYMSLSFYTEGQYKSTMGGPFTINDDELELLVEYSDISPEIVGSVQKHKISLEGENVKDARGHLWIKQPTISQDLDGLWRITGRQQNGVFSEIPRGDRKTIKLLVDGYFQWIAINPVQKGFYGTGGGRYTFVDGKYTEDILFFSRDNSRIGASLHFSGKLVNGQWHHSGKSSKGNNIYEIWSRDNAK